MTTSPKSAWAARAALACALSVVPLATTGCQSTKELYADTFLDGTTITYAQYLTQDSRAVPRPTVDSVIEALGMPAEVDDVDGIRRRVEYHAFSMTGELKRAEFRFDREEKLEKKRLW